MHSALATILRHTDKYEVVVCINGSAIERFYDEQDNEIEMVVMKIGSKNLVVRIEQVWYHSLEATDKMCVVFGRKHIGTILMQPNRYYQWLK